MIKLILTCIIAIHGLLHLLGFIKEWNLANVGQFKGRMLIPFSGNSLKVFGIFWFVACILFLVSASSFYFQHDWFWIIATAGVIISQTLIIMYWHDAKWGTAVNVMILIIAIFGAGRVAFNNMVNREVSSILLQSSSKRQRLLLDQDAGALPEIIQTWLKKSNVIGKPIPRSVHIIQKGAMRTSAQSNWMPFDAEQYFTIDQPGFVWNASIRANMFVDIVGRDKYEKGKGNMLIKVASLIPMANSSGKEIDQGTMIRYMAEMVWFPHAIVNNYLHWEQVDEHRAKVTMTYYSMTVSGIYTFNNDGLPISFEAKRFGEFDGKYSMETWQVNITSYALFNGIPVGNTCEVMWKLKDGDFTWLRLEIIDIEYK